MSNNVVLAMDLQTNTDMRTPHGPELRPDGTVCFRLWAPACEHISLELQGATQPLRMKLSPDGWHELTTEARAGTRYSFVLPDGTRVPDPASRYQPEDVHGPSEIVDTHNWEWSDSQWVGRPWQEAVIYELHVGAFTPEGTFQGIREKLDHLVSLGVTALQIMPVADFPGRRNWGYDGVLPYAPDSSYGRPEDLKALIEAAHHRGLMVFLDVVYNHFGPDGNYLPLYAPGFFTDRHKTPWGDGVNFDGPGSRVVRDFVIQNALYWVRDYHLDGLRLDAVHAILDDSSTHLLEEIATTIRASVPQRQIHLILENEENQASRLERDGKGGVLVYTAQWNDDVHHTLHTAITGEDKGYYQEYLRDTTKLGRALAEGFAFQGEMMHYRGEPRGEHSAHLPPTAFVAFLQNHDQVGNRAFGDRIASTTDTSALRAAAATYLLLPQIPMLFMGEEWAATSPFPFFCDFQGDLAEAVRRGRREEFARFPEFQDPEQRARIPDPQADATYEAGKLDWAEVTKDRHRDWLEWYKRLLTQRRKHIVPLLSRIRHGGVFNVLAEGAVLVRWRVEEEQELILAVNLSGLRVGDVPLYTGPLIWQEGSFSPDEGLLEPWSVRCWLADQGGAR